MVAFFLYDHRNVSSWSDIVAVAAGAEHTVGLKSDGTVVATGNNQLGQCDVSSWKDIVAVSACDWHTVGLKSDGTVVAAGENNYGQCNVSSWSDIVAVATSGHHTVGLKSDGTVVATGNNQYGQCNVSSWTDIVAVAAGKSPERGCCWTVGLKTNGQAIAVGYNEYGQCNVSSWSDIVAVHTVFNTTFGLKSDGTVISTNSDDNAFISELKDVVDITGSLHAYFLKSDGSIAANGWRFSEMSEWKGILIPAKLRQ